VKGWILHDLRRTARSLPVSSREALAAQRERIVIAPRRDGRSDHKFLRR
jgi:hypothetical protein